jgi:uncharacterized protein YlxP (DUF503 family)
MRGHPRRPYLALLTITVRLADAMSLKDKRMMVRSLKDGVRSRMGATVAEIDGLDEKRRAVVTAAILSNSRAGAEEMLARLEDDVERRFGGYDLELASEIVEL